METSAMVGISTQQALAEPLAVSGNVKENSFYTPIPHSLDGKLMIVTGGTTGLGLETCKRLAMGGARVVLTSRTEAKGQSAIDAIQEYIQDRGVQNKNIFSVMLDLDDLSSVKTFSERLSKAVGKEQKVDVLVNNAGVMAIPERELTKDGFERTFQSNHLGHFVLTAELMDRLATDARIINVSSEAYQFAPGELDFNNLNGESNYGPWSSYGESKLANILFAKELQRRADAGGRSIKAYSLHPGAVQTDLGRNLMGPEKWERMKTEGLKGWDALLLNTLSKFIKTVEDGASTQIYLAASEDVTANVAGGTFFVNMKPESVKKFADDMEAANKLWKVSEEMGNITFKL
jgi:NAD(P)-dependent dehydrogenase (short-subunit alcohol dehydrogenase family)